MADDNELSVGYGRAFLKAQGSLIIVVLFILLGMWFSWNLHQQNIYLFEKSETERRLLEQEARLEVQMIRAKQDLIVGNISRFCGVTYQGSEESRALEAWYLRRKQDLEQKRAEAEAEMAREEALRKLKPK